MGSSTKAQEMEGKLDMAECYVGRAKLQDLDET